MNTDISKYDLKSLQSRAEKAMSGTLVERLAVISDGLAVIADIEIAKLESQLRALAVVTKDRAERGRL
jgi:hypothetical protein